MRVADTLTADFDIIDLLHTLVTECVALLDVDAGGLVIADENGDPQPTTASLDQSTWTIPDGEIFLMGDHRSNSADSRTFGPVAVDQIIGRAWLRYWPFDTFGVLPTPTYPELAQTAP